MLLRVDGPSGHRNHSLEAGAAPLIAGRGTNVDIHLPDVMRSISRRHVSFALEGSGVRVTVVSEALGALSSKGELLPGASQLLNVGDHVTVGVYRLSVLLPEPREGRVDAPANLGRPPAAGAFEASFDGQLAQSPPPVERPQPAAPAAGASSQPAFTPGLGGIVTPAPADSGDLLALIMPIEGHGGHAPPAAGSLGNEYWVVPPSAPAPPPAMQRGPAALDDSGIEAVQQAVGPGGAAGAVPLDPIEHFLSGASAGSPAHGRAAEGHRHPGEEPLRIVTAPPSAGDDWGWAVSAPPPPPHQPSPPAHRAVPAAHAAPPATWPGQAPAQVPSVPPSTTTPTPGDADDDLWGSLVNLVGLDAAGAPVGASAASDLAAQPSTPGPAAYPNVPAHDTFFAPADPVAPPAHPQPVASVPDPSRASVRPPPAAAVVPPLPETAPAAAAPLASAGPAAGTSSSAAPAAGACQTASAAAAPAGADLAAVIDTLSQALGTPLPAHMSLAEWRQFGTTLRALVQGYEQLLLERDDVRSTLGVPGRTEMYSHDNNPLKIRATPAERIKLLTLGSNAGKAGRYLAAEDAIAEATEDLKLHNLALIAACRVSMEELVRSFNPDRWEAEEGKGKRVPVFGEAQLWRRYCEHYRKQGEHMADWLQRLFDQHFVNAYSRESDRPQRARPVRR